MQHINIMKFKINIIYKLIVLSIFCISTYSNATGVLPDTTLLVISEENGVSQIGISNTENKPLLLITTIMDLPEDKDVTLLALPAITRIEANGRQIVRFILDKSNTPLKVQHLKRVQFEGIPIVDNTEGKSTVRVSLRQDIPVVISPSNLKQDPEPWKYLKLNWTNGKIILSNPSAYVIRLSQSISVLQNSPAIKVLPRTYVLPGESFSVDIPSGIPENVNFVRIFPASPYGFEVPPYDTPLSR